MGRGEERVLAQPVQEAPHQVGGEGGELPRTRPAGLLPNSLQENDFGWALSNPVRILAPSLDSDWTC